MLHATSIMQLYPRTVGQGQTIHETSYYEVGKMCQISKVVLEEVEEIIILTEPQLIADIRFKDYGTIWITSNIIEIRFENQSYKEVLKERKNKKDEKG